jgi:DNA-binding transcriptional LysR family regulator
MVELGIRELQYHQQVQELLNQRIDIGFVPIRFPELESELVFECVRKAPFLVALPTEHPLAKQRRLRLSALANEKFISIRRTAPAYHSWFVNHCRSAGFMPEIGVLPTVVSSGAIWTEIETGFHIELEAPVRINVLPD